jgi:hypothetical protein
MDPGYCEKRGQIAIRRQILPQGVFMKRIIAALLIALFSFCLFSCVTDPNKLDRARNSNNRAQREMNRAFK